MGWDRRGDRLYLYRSVRINGRPVREYLGTAATFAGLVPLPGEQPPPPRRDRYRRQTEDGDAVRGWAAGLLGELDTAVNLLRIVADGVLSALGYHRHNRGEWRMKRGLKALTDEIVALQGALVKPKPLLNYQAPGGDAEAVEVFAQARAGDATAQARVRTLIIDRDWVSWIGDLGRQATFQLIDRAAAGDPVWKSGLTEKANALRRELLGVNPSALDELLVRRVVNGWLATHTIEMELAVRPPLDSRAREQLDRALTRAQKRMTDAARELARVRRLALPVVIATLNLGSTPGATDANARLLPAGVGATG